METKSIYMKIMPFFNKNGKPEADIDIVQKRKEDGNSGIVMNTKLDFNEIFRSDSSARFMKINTDLLEEEGIFKNDIAVIDSEVEVVNGKIILVKVNETLMIRRYEKIRSGHMLYGDIKKISPLKIEEGYDQFKILGVVIYIIKSLN